MLSFPRRAGVIPGVRFDLEVLKQEIKRLRARPELVGRTQINLVQRAGAVEPPFIDGTGSLWDPKLKKMVAQESEFTEFHREWRQSALYAAYETLAQRTGFHLGRFRVMIIEPRRCYSIHKDPGLRLHIPIITNNESFFLFGDCPPLHFPAGGGAFWADTRQGHSAMNGHLEDERIHLVASAMETPSRKFDDFIAESEKASK